MTKGYDMAIYIYQDNIGCKACCSCPRPAFVRQRGISRIKPQLHSLFKPSNVGQNSVPSCVS